jgi:hypothetical protein
MSFISITAPVFTEEDERIERESMSPEELEEVHNDTHGINTFEATPEMVQHGPYELQLALEDIHEEEKEVYLEALRMCPELVEQESNYLMFLRSENYNVWVSQNSVAYNDNQSYTVGKIRFARFISFHTKEPKGLNQLFTYFGSDIIFIGRGGTIAQVLGVSKVAIWRRTVPFAHDYFWKWCHGRGRYCVATKSSYSLFEG